jgi:tRNA(fMet)-specific endonuclease VapC
LIIDTNALSAFADEENEVISLIGKAAIMAVPVVVIGEYRSGIAGSRYRVRYEGWLESMLSDCSVLEVTLETAVHYSEIHTELKQAGRPIPTNDLWIAALARQHSLPVLSRDRHFEFVPHLRRISW